MKSDEALMAAYVAGDSDAFAEMFSRYAPVLNRIMRRWIRSEDDAKDLVQQTFLQLHRARNDFQPGRALRPWLMTIAFNLRREHYRKKVRRPEASLDFEPAAKVDDRGDPLERKSEAERVRSALAQLPEGQRDVIGMHWLEELSFPEIAEITGLTLSAVKVRAHRGYKVLRQLLSVTAEGAAT